MAKVKQSATASAQGQPDEGVPSSFLSLMVGSIGVVYGDIGTSPLYSVKESLSAAKGDGPLTPEMVFGVLSLIIWTLVVIVTFKYVLIMMRADNNGEGGTLSLMALAQRALGGRVRYISLIGMAGAALFYGDAMITPSISVLSAVEGLSLVTKAFDPFVLVISLAILFLLFAGQSVGTARIATFFGPVMLVWFAAMALGGVVHIVAHPSILGALNPVHGVWFLATHGLAGLVALGAVFLAVTGAEALYADLGHFGRRPIQFAWLVLVFPSLLLNYLGQGALLLGKPEALENPFFKLYPQWALVPMIVLATIATIIASQAVITGAYSVTQQAMQLGLLPRMQIRQTSAKEKGQIYVPMVNWLLLVAVMYLTLAFRNSSALASAYGIAVTGTMVVTVILAIVVARFDWKWPWWKALAVMIPFLVVDSIFLGANLIKIFDGGWLPLVVGAGLFVTMITWRRGAQLLREKTVKEELPIAEYLPMIEAKAVDRVQGTAVFMTGHPEHVPTALMHNLKHNKIMHKRNFIVGVDIANVPRVDEAERATVKKLSETFSVIRLKFGYMEAPDVPRALARRRLHLELNPQETSFYLSRRILKPAAKSQMFRWQDRFFIWLARGSSDAAHYFAIPTDRVIEVGTQIMI